jgi:hypothetical protein
MAEIVVNTADPILGARVAARIKAYALRDGKTKGFVRMRGTIIHWYLLPTTPAPATHPSPSLGGASVPDQKLSPRWEATAKERSDHPH